MTKQHDLYAVSRDGLIAAELELEKRALVDDHLSFIRLMFSAVEGTPFIVSPHHRLMCQQIDRVFKGECKRLIINIPPGLGKTEIAVINFVARGYAVNQKARFIHASYSDKLVNDNSVRIKNLINHEEFQKRWPVTFKADSSAKGLWRTTAGGHFLASPSGGSITGFRAGYLNARNLGDDLSSLEDYERENMSDDATFTGAMIIDDPLKPDDAQSETTRSNINQRWPTTFSSRLAHEDVPVIVIMQRLHVDDFTHYLLESSGEEWEVLSLPAVIEGEVEPPHPNAIMIPHNLADGPLWLAKLPMDKIEKLKLEETTFHAQYMQSPIVLGGNMFKREYFGTFDPDHRPNLKRRLICADTASKTKERNDYSVFACFGVDAENRLYVLDLVRGKWEAPELATIAVQFYEKHKAMDWNTNGMLESINIEDASSGTALIQHLQRQRLPIKGIPVEIDKVTKAYGCIPTIAVSPVLLPDRAPWLTDFQNELFAFPEGKHDDQCDVLMMGVMEMLFKTHNIYDVLV
ncbi:MAG: phage terminase large subunit [Hyphomicrobiales bacterium]